MKFRVPVTPNCVTPWSRFRLGKIVVPQKWRILIRKSYLAEKNTLRHCAVPVDLTCASEFACFSASQEIPRVTAVFIGAPTCRCLIQSIQFTPSHSVYFRSILILSSHLPLALPIGLVTLGFPAKTLHTFLFFTIHATFSDYPILLVVMIQIV
jgi:hypothetical protein